MRVELGGHYGYGKIIRGMAPMVAMMLVTSVYSIVDGFFISNFSGCEAYSSNTAFAAMNIIWPALAILAAFGLMIGSGGSALVSKTFGEGDAAKACDIFTVLVRFSMIVGAIAAVFSFILMKPLVVALGAEGEMIPLAVMYGRFIVVTLPFYIVNMAAQSFYMTAEKPHLGTLMSIVCGLMNIGLDALFIVGFKWGLKGAAIATALSLFTGGVYPLLYFTSKRNDSHLRIVRGAHTSWRHILKSCTNGMSEYVGNIALSVVSICYNIQLMKYIGEKAHLQTSVSVIVEKPV